MLSLYFRTDNAAFGGDSRGPEAARILREVARHIDDGETEGTARDVNGNKVGRWAFGEKEEA